MVRYRSLSAVVVAFLLLAPVVVGLAALLDMALGQIAYTSVLIGVVVCLVLVLFGLVARRGARRSDDGSAGVWALIPSWQYDGRHVESGGLTRDEQEAALADIDEQAAAHDRDSR